MNDKPESRVWRQGQPDDEVKPVTNYIVQCNAAEIEHRVIADKLRSEGYDVMEQTHRDAVLHSAEALDEASLERVLLDIKEYHGQALSIKPTHMIVPGNVAAQWSRTVAYWSEGWRPICPKRARKLRRRGEDVRYLPEFGSNAWIPPHLREDH